TAGGVSVGQPGGVAPANGGFPPNTLISTTRWRISDWGQALGPLMRNFIRAAIVLVILVAAYWGWALIGAAELASVASQVDAEAVMRRVDLPALRRSLASQIARAYLEQNPQFKKLLSLEQGFVGSVGGGAADALLRELLTPENIAALLNKGRVGLPKGEARDAVTLWRMPPLGRRGPRGAWVTLLQPTRGCAAAFSSGAISAARRSRSSPRSRMCLTPR